MKFPDFLEELLEAGICVTLYKRDDYGFAFDLNLRAKSGMHLVWDEDAKSWAVLMRYDEKFLIDDVDDLKYYAKHGMHGRNFIDPYWADFIGLDDC